MDPDLLAASQKINAMTPLAVGRVAQDERVGIICVPGGLRLANPPLHRRIQSQHLGFHRTFGSNAPPGLRTISRPLALISP